MTVLYKPETGLTSEANLIYALNAKSQGSTTWSDLTGKTRAFTISWCTKQVFKCCPDAETVAFEVIETKWLGYGVQPLYQGWLGQGTIVVPMFVGEKMAIFGWVVDAEMILKVLLWVLWAVLWCTWYFFTIGPAFGFWQLKCHYFMAVLVFFFTYIGWSYMECVDERGWAQ